MTIRNRILNAHILGSWHTRHALSFLTCCLTASLLAFAVSAGTPTLDVWTGDSKSAVISSDELQTNQWYSTCREIGIHASIYGAASDDMFCATGLTVTCTLPTSLSPYSLDSDNSIPFYAQWNTKYASLVQQIATPLDQSQGWSSYIEVAASNAWVRPLVYANRSVDNARLPPNETVYMTLVCKVLIPAGALSGMATFSVQPITWDIDTDSLNISYVTNSCSSASFGFDSTYRTFVCVQPGLLAGAYSFTNYLEVTSTADHDMKFAPGIQIMYSRTQTAWAVRSSAPSRSLTHTYDNGVRAVVSSPSPVLWHDQQMQDQTSWTIGSKYVSADADEPGLTQCVVIRSQDTCYDGRTSPQFFVSAEGTNLVSATLTIPNGTVYSMEVESDKADFDLASRTDDDLVSFTNGTYLVKLYNITNALRQTYTVQLAGTPVAETPEILTPDTLCVTNVRPHLSWNASTDPNINATVLQIDGPSLEDGIFNMWTEYEYDPLPTEYTSEQDLFGVCAYDLMFAHASITTDNGAQIISGYLADQHGFFNVETQSLTFVHLDTDAPRVFTGNPLEIDLTTFGFLPGTNYTFMVDFGDGFTTNKTWGIHPYTHPGTYTARVIVTDDTGVSATGTVAMAVYDLPVLSQITRINASTVGLTFPTIADASYRLAYTDNLVAPNWSSTVGTKTGDGSTQMIQDTPSGSATQRFYRLECTLNP